MEGFYCKSTQLYHNYKNLANSLKKDYLAYIHISSFAFQNIKVENCVYFFDFSEKIFNCIQSIIIIVLIIYHRVQAPN